MILACLSTPSALLVAAGLFTLGSIYASIMHYLLR